MIIKALKFDYKIHFIPDLIKTSRGEHREKPAENSLTPKPDRATKSVTNRRRGSSLK